MLALEVVGRETRFGVLEGIDTNGGVVMGRKLVGRLRQGRLSELGRAGRRDLAIGATVEVERPASAPFPGRRLARRVPMRKRTEPAAATAEHLVRIRIQELLFAGNRINVRVRSVDPDHRAVEDKVLSLPGPVLGLYSRALELHLPRHPTFEVDGAEVRWQAFPTFLLARVDDLRRPGSPPEREQVRRWCARSHLVHRLSPDDARRARWSTFRSRTLTTWSRR